ncbi:MAG: hypothetical protein R3F17_02060 [Planctomycetota bacterium]
MQALPLFIGLSLAAPAAAQATFSTFGLVAPSQEVNATDLSADGSVVVGINNNQAFRWTEAGGYTYLGALPDPLPVSFARAVSADGNVVVGWSNSTSDVARGFRWDATNGMVALEPLSYSLGIGLSGAEAVGGAAQWIGGYSYDTDIDQPTVWDIAGNPIRLPLPPTHPWGYVNDIADQAPIAVGSAVTIGGQVSAFHAVIGGALTLIGAPAGYSSSRAQAVSADGSVVLGTCRRPDQSLAMFRWSQATGFEVLAAPIGGAGELTLTGCNANGTVAVGFEVAGGGPQGFYWSEGTGTVSLNALLLTHGATGLSPTAPLRPNAVSADGNIIVGRTGGPGTGPAWFRAQLSPVEPTAIGSDFCAPSIPNSVGLTPRCKP